MFARRMVLLLLACLLGGCAAIPVITAATPTPTMMASPKSSETPSLTPVPSLTPIPSITPFPPLSGTGPYLMLKQEYYAKMFLIYNWDGRGRRILLLPNDCHMESWNLQTAISPDGKWVVCYTGSLRSADFPENLPLTLHVVNIADGTSRKVTDIVTEDYQKKLDVVASDLQRLFPEKYKPRDDMAWALGAVTMAFKSSINAVAWSPDSRMLAFAGQIEGNSSDVYTYDVATGAIQQVEDSLQSVARIRWSPTGEYIVFQNSLPDPNYGPTSFHAVKLGEKVVREPKILQSWWFGGVIDWLSPTVLLVTDGTDTAGATTLSTINISSGEGKKIWDGMYGEVAVDHENQLIALTASEFTQEQDWGMHFITFDGAKKKIADGWYYNLFFRGGYQTRFSVLRYSKPEFQVGISLDGSVSELNWQKGNISISPDYSWVLIYDKKSAHLYDKNDELVKSLDVTNIDEVIWRPDSQGFFYSAWDSESYLVYVSIPSGEPVIVDRCLAEFCRFDLNENATWLP